METEPTPASRAGEKTVGVARSAEGLVPGGLVWSFAGHESEDSGNRVSLFEEFGGIPPVFTKGRGGVLVDVDGQEYVDYIGADGAAILGHADERIVAAISKAVVATTVLPLPTSPCNRRDMGSGFCKSAIISSSDRFWAPVNSNGSDFRKVSATEVFIPNGIPGWLLCHSCFLLNTPSCSRNNSSKASLILALPFIFSSSG